MCGSAWPFRLLSSKDGPNDTTEHEDIGSHVLWRTDTVRSQLDRNMVIKNVEAKQNRSIGPLASRRSTSGKLDRPENIIENNSLCHETVMISALANYVVP